MARDIFTVVCYVFGNEYYFDTKIAHGHIALKHALFSTIQIRFIKFTNILYRY